MNILKKAFLALLLVGTFVNVDLQAMQQGSRSRYPISARRQTGVAQQSQSQQQEQQQDGFVNRVTTYFANHPRAMVLCAAAAPSIVYRVLLGHFPHPLGYALLVPLVVYMGRIRQGEGQRPHQE